MDKAAKEFLLTRIARIEQSAKARHDEAIGYQSMAREGMEAAEQDAKLAHDLRALLNIAEEMNYMARTCAAVEALAEQFNKVSAGGNSILTEQA